MDFSPFFVLKKYNQLILFLFFGYKIILFLPMHKMLYYVNVFAIYLSLVSEFSTLIATLYITIRFTYLTQRTNSCFFALSKNRVKNIQMNNYQEFATLY
jgi:hypothetical protein